MHLAVLHSLKTRSHTFRDLSSSKCWEGATKFGTPDIHPAVLFRSISKIDGLET